MAFKEELFGKLYQIILLSCTKLWSNDRDTTGEILYFHDDDDDDDDDDDEN